MLETIRTYRRLCLGLPRINFLANAAPLLHFIFNFCRRFFLGSGFAGGQLSGSDAGGGGPLLTADPTVPLLTHQHRWVSLGQPVSLGQTGSVKVSLGQARSAWVRLGQSGSAWVVLGHAGSCWVSLGQSGSTWVNLGPSGSA